MDPAPAPIPIDSPTPSTHRDNPWNTPAAAIPHNTTHDNPQKAQQP
ncbi:hypothetical protein [Streptomyces katrae]|nr:hypothetical protein [Streptomyces katrae]